MPPVNKNRLWDTLSPDQQRSIGDLLATTDVSALTKDELAARLKNDPHLLAAIETGAAHQQPYSRDNFIPFFAKLINQMAKSGIVPYNGERILRYLNSVGAGFHHQTYIAEGRVIRSDEVRMRKVQKGSTSYILAPYGQGLLICKIDNKKTLTFTLSHQLHDPVKNLFKEGLVSDEILTKLLEQTKFYNPEKMASTGHSFFIHEQYGPILLAGHTENSNEDSPFLYGNSFDPSMVVFTGSPAAEIQNPWDPQNLPDQEILMTDSQALPLIAAAKESLKKKGYRPIDLQKIVATINQNPEDYVVYNDQSSHIYVLLTADFSVQKGLPIVLKINSKTQEAEIALGLALRPMEGISRPAKIANTLDDNFQRWKLGLLEPAIIREYLDSLEFTPIQQIENLSYAENGYLGLWYLMESPSESPRNKVLFRLFDEAAQSKTFFKHAAPVWLEPNPYAQNNSKATAPIPQINPADLETMVTNVPSYSVFNPQVAIDSLLSLTGDHTFTVHSNGTPIRYVWSVIKSPLSGDYYGLSVYRIVLGESPQISFLITNTRTSLAEAILGGDLVETAQELAKSTFYPPTQHQGHIVFYQPGLGHLLLALTEGNKPHVVVPFSSPTIASYFDYERTRIIQLSPDEARPVHPLLKAQEFSEHNTIAYPTVSINGSSHLVLPSLMGSGYLLVRKTGDQLELNLILHPQACGQIERAVLTKTALDKMPAVFLQSPVPEGIEPETWLSKTQDGDRWQIIREGNQILIRYQGQESQFAKVFSLGNLSFFNLTAALKKPGVIKPKLNLVNEVFPSLLLRQKHPGLTLGALLAATPDGLVFFTLLTAEQVDQILAKQDQALFTVKDLGQLHIFDPIEDDAFRYQDKSNRLAAQVTPTGLQISNTSGMRVSDLWEFWPEAERVHPKLFADFIKRIKAGDPSVLSITDAQGNLKNYIQIESPWGIGLLGLSPDNEVLVHLFKYPVDGRMIYLSDELIKNPMHVFVITENGVPKTQRIPLNNANNDLLAIDNDGTLHIVSSMEESPQDGLLKVAYHTFDFAGRKLAPLSFDLLENLTDTINDINSPKRLATELVVSLNGSSMDSENYPITVSLKEGAKSISVGNAKKAATSITATIAFGPGEASRLPYQFETRSGRTYLIPINHSPAGTLEIKTSQTGQTFITITDPDSEISQLLDGGIYGRRLRVTLKDLGAGKFALFLKGNFDANRELLRGITNIWVTDEDKKPQEYGTDPDWEVSFEFDRSKINFILDKLYRVYALYQIGQHVNHDYAISRVSQAPKEAKKGDRPKSIIKQIALPSIAGEPDRIIDVEFIKESKESPWIVKQLNYQGISLLNSPNNANLRVVSADDGSAHLIAETKKGWETFQLRVDPANQSLTVFDHTYITRQSQMLPYVAESDKSFPGDITLSVLNNPLTGRAELVDAAIAHKDFRFISPLPLPLTEALELELAHDYLGAIRINFIKNEEGVYSYQWPQTHYHLSIDENKNDLLLTVGRNKSWRVPFITTEDGRKIIEAKSIAIINQWHQLTGRDPVSEDHYEIAAINGQIQLINAYLNKDGSYAPTQWPQQDRDLKLLQQGQATYHQEPYFHATDWSLKAGDLLLPLRDWILKLSALFKNVRNRSGVLTPGDQGSYQLRLPNGLVMHIPYQIVYRATNPFKLNTQGLIQLGPEGNPLATKDGKPILDGSRVSLTLPAEPGTHWVADESLSSFDQGGNWVFTIATPTGARELTMIRHPLAPAIMALVETSEVKGDEKDRTTLLNAAKQQLLRYVDFVIDATESPGPFKISSIINNDGAISYIGVRGQEELTISGVRFENGQWHYPRQLAVSVKDRSGFTRSIDCETSLLTPNILKLTEVTNFGRIGQIYYWDRSLNIFYREASQNSGAEIDRTRSEQKLRSLGFPIREAKAQLIDAEANAKTPPNEYFLVVDHPIPVMPLSQKGFVYPDRIDAITKTATIEDLLSTTNLHDLVFEPTEACALTMAYRLQDKRMMTFGSQSGVILQLPMRVLADSTHNYTLDWDALNGDTLIGARLLIPDTKNKGHFFELRVSPVEKIKPGSSPAEVTLNLMDAPKINIKLSRVENTQAKHTVFGYHMIFDKKRSHLNAKNIRAEHDTWVKYLGLHQKPDLFDGSVLDGFSDLTLDDGSLLDLSLTRSGNQLRLNNLAYKEAQGFFPNKLSFEALTEASDTARLEFFSEGEGSPIFYTHNPATNTWDYFVITKNGDLKIWNRPHHIRDFMSPPASVDFKMTAIEGYPYGYKNGGATYAPEGDIKDIHSVATRLQKTGPEATVQEFEITSLMGRWNGATPTAFTPDSKDSVARLRFMVSVLADGSLAARPLGRKEIEIENGVNFPWGDHFRIEVLEDEWLDDDATIQKGRVRIIFHQPDGQKANLAPYGWLEFANREALIGATDKFTVDLAHHHETSSYQDKKLFGHQRGFLTQRAGTRVNNPIDFESIFASLSDDMAAPLKNTLKRTLARHGDIPDYVSVLKDLSKVGSINDVFDAAGCVIEETLKSLAQYALSLNPETPTGTTGTKGSGSRSRTATGSSASVAKPAHKDGTKLSLWENPGIQLKTPVPPPVLELTDDAANPQPTYPGLVQLPVGADTAHLSGATMMALRPVAFFK